MKVTVNSKKGLKIDLKVFVDKKTMNVHMSEKYEELKKNVALKVLDLEKFQLRY